MVLEDVIDDRVSYLLKIAQAVSNPIVKATFQAEADILRKSDRRNVTLLILQKRKEIDLRGDISRLEILWAELNALEWLQWQVDRLE